MWLSELTLQMIVFRILALLLIVGVHGAIVAAAAVALGDRGPRYDGRLSLAPTRHADLVGSICLVIFGLGWSKPVAVDPAQLRGGRAGLVIVLLSGAAGLLLMAWLLVSLVLPALTSLPHSAGLTVSAFLRVAASLTIAFALLGLVPVPPLAGGLLLEALGIRLSRGVRQILVAALVVAIATGTIRTFLEPALVAVSGLIMGG